MLGEPGAAVAERPVERVGAEGAARLDPLGLMAFVQHRGAQARALLGVPACGVDCPVVGWNERWFLRWPGHRISLPCEVRCGLMAEIVSGHEIAKTHLCKTPGCDREARAAQGRHAYCRDCQIRRGTRRADGSFISEAIPLAPGSRHVRDLFRGDGCGPFEKSSIEVVAAARGVDALLAQIIQAQETIRDAKARLPEAVRLWRETLERVSASDARSMVVTASSNGTEAD
jgi:hypothetical protein